jgi:hypothetical protein
MNTNKHFSFEIFSELQRSWDFVLDLLKAKTSDITITRQGLLSRCQKAKLPPQLKLIEKYGTTDHLPCINFYLNKHLQNLNYSTGIGLYELTEHPEVKIVSFHSEIAAEYYHVNVFRTADLEKIVKVDKQLEESLARIRLIKPLIDENIMKLVIDNTIGILKHTKRIKELGGKVKRGIIIYGPPGNGKTLLSGYIKALAQRSHFNTKNISNSAIKGAYGNGTLSTLLDEKGVVFFDDIEVSFLDRARGQAEIACGLLSAMDGIGQSKASIRIFTTNEDVETIDPAFVRPGRIDIKIKLNKPDATFRKQFLATFDQQILDRLPPLDKVVDATDDYSFAELDAIRSMVVTNIICEEKTTFDSVLELIKKPVEKRKKGLGFNA